MRKLILFLVATFTAVLALGVASATAGSIFATGAGWESAGPLAKHFIHFDISAHSGPQGDSGQVHFSIADTFGAPLDVTVNLDCVNVFPFTPFQGVAWVGGAVTKASPQPNAYGITPGTRLLSYAVDGGNPSSTTPVDQFDEFFEFASCNTLSFFGYFPNVSQGNVNISTG